MNSTLWCLILLAVPAMCPGQPASQSTESEAANRPGAITLRQKLLSLPIGAVRPRGWLQDQLKIQARGLSGHLDELWPELKRSQWKGLDGDAWESTPYYLNGLVPLAYILRDERLIAKSKVYIDWILDSARPDGSFGPKANADPWPRVLAMKTLMSYYEATKDDRVLELMANYFRLLIREPREWPSGTWYGARSMEHAVVAHWLYRQTGAPEPLEAVAAIRENSFDWASFFLDFPFDTGALERGEIPTQFKGRGMQAHGVNLAMALKYPALWYSQSGDERARGAVTAARENLERYHGQLAGRFSGDDHLSGRSPSRGTELCMIVDQMFSLEKILEVFGDADLGDQLEDLAYNALPAALAADFWSHQYLQQSNQAIVSQASRPWSSTGPDSLLYGLMGEHPSCLVNMHQGWPLLVKHLWMATPDEGLAAVAYGPTEVTAQVAGGVTAHIVEDTDYPFDGEVRFRLELPRAVRFPIHLRIPKWAQGARLQYKNKSQEARAGRVAVLEERWQTGDQIGLSLPMQVVTERRYNDSIAIRRGPLYYSLRIGTEYRRTRVSSRFSQSIDYRGSVDWEISPATPWNYALVIDPLSPGDFVTITRHEIQKYPFAEKGEMVYSDSADQYHSWPEEPPIVITAKGKALPEWKLKDNSAEAPPRSPVISDASPETLQLIPYGCSRLRVAEFPYVMSGVTGNH